MSLLFLIPSVYGEIEYTNGNIQYYTTLFADPRSVRVTCSDIFPEECAFLTFDDNVFSNSVKLIYSIDNFTSIYSTYVIPSSDLSNSVNFIGEYYPLPFDITYFNGTFYFFVANKMYNFTRVNGVQLMYSLAGYYNGLNFVDDGTIWMVQKACQSGGNYAGTYWAYTTNGTLTKIADELTCNCGTGQSITKAQGWGAKNGNTFRWYWKNYIPYSSGVNCSSSNMGSFPSDFNGLFYYDGNSIVYHRAENVTANISGGVWKTDTDLTTFQTEELIYAENTSINEKIRASDHKSGFGYSVYAFERNTNSSYSPSGIYTYYSKEYQLKIVPYFWNINTLAQETGTISANIVCGNESDSYSGTTITASVTCRNPEITLISSYEPTVYTFTYNIPSGCEDTINYIFPTYYKSYWAKIYTIDSITGNYISNASVTVDSDTNITGTDGYAEFYIYPLVNTSFSIETNEPQCYSSLKVSGNPKAFQVYSTAIGYNDDFETIQFISGSPETPSDFDISKSISLLPSSASVSVHLYTKDSVEINPSTSITRENGTQKTYWYYNNDYYLTNIVSDSLPITFILVDNRTNWTSNISIEYYGKTYYKEINVEKQKNYRVDLYIDDLATNMSCTSNSDCSDSFCKGIYYKSFQGCINNKCVYENTKCLSSILCDDLVGCFDIKSTDTCNSDFDCNSSCLNNYTMITGKCLSDGYCGFIKRNCDELCNYTIGMCNEFSQCLKKNEQTFKVELIKNSVTVLGQEITVVCDLSNAGKKQCVPEIIIKKSDLSSFGSTVNDLVISPKGYPYQETTDSYRFLPVSISCSETCDMSYEFCQKDCSFDTGECVGGGTPISDITGNVTGWIVSGVETLNMIFPNIYYKTMISSIFIIIIVFLIVYYLGSNNWQIGVVIAIIMVASLAFVGWFDPLITIIFIILSSFVIARFTFWRD